LCTIGEEKFGYFQVIELEIGDWKGEDSQVYVNFSYVWFCVKEWGFSRSSTVKIIEATNCGFKLNKCILQL